MAPEMQSPGGDETPRKDWIVKEAETLREQSNRAFEQPIKKYSVRENSLFMESFERNKGLYAQIVLRYAANWATLMEDKMNKGEKLEEIAGVSSAEAFSEDIKGILYMDAVSILADSWEHGEELRHWHNLESSAEGQ